MSVSRGLTIELNSPVSFSRSRCFVFDNDNDLSIAGDSLHISPLERSYKAKVLMHFPSNVEWNPFDEDAVRMVSLLPKLLSLIIYLKIFDHLCFLMMHKNFYTCTPSSSCQIFQI